MPLSKNLSKSYLMIVDNFLFKSFLIKKTVRIDCLLIALATFFFCTKTYCQAYSVQKQISYCQSLMEQGLLIKAENQIGFLYKNFFSKATARHKARLLNLMGDCYFEQERIDSAYYYYSKSSNWHGLHKDSSLLAATWLKIGNCFEAQFDPGLALTYYEKVLEYSQKNGFEKLHVKALVAIALSKEREGNFDSAERYLDAAMKLASRVDDPYLLAQTRFNYYNLLAATNRAEETLQALAGRYMDLFSFCNKYRFQWLKARTCIELSKLLKPENGLTWCLKAETLSNAVLPGNHPFHAIVYHRLAEQYRELGNSALSAQFYRRALKTKKQHFGFPHIALWSDYLSLSTALKNNSAASRLSIVDSALQCFGLRLEVVEPVVYRKKIPIEALEVMLQGALIGAEDPNGQYDRLSVQLFNQIVDQSALWRRHYVTPKQRRYFQGTIGEICNMAVNGCWKLYSKHPKRLYMEWAFTFSERGKYVALQEQVIRKQLSREEDVWTKQIDSLEQLLSGIYSMDNFSGRGSNDKKIKIEHALEHAYAAWRKTEAGREFDAMEPVPLDRLAEILRKNEVFISYHFSDTLYAFVIGRERFDFYCLNYDAETIESWKHWVSGHHRNTDLNNYQVYGSEIFDELILPLSISSAERVLIAPHGPYLNGLPFEALLTKRDDQIIHWNKLHYWLNEQVIAYQPSASVWYSMKRSPFSYPVISFLGIAPDFTQNNMHCFSEDLKQNYEDVRCINGIMALLGIQCDTAIGFTDKAHLLGKLKISPSFVHFSTHGKPFADDFPAGIILNCGAKNDCKDCILQYEEIAGVNMTHTYMATFSACSTADGEHIVGEGLSGMVYAFVGAGVRNTVATLFAVNETSANLLFKRFYSNLLDKKILPSEALNAAKRGIARMEQAKPADWAGFVYFGPDDAPIFQRKCGHWLYAGALISMLLAFIFWLRKKATKS